jgi:hypothetical protein
MHLSEILFRKILILELIDAMHVLGISISELIKEMQLMFFGKVKQSPA